MSYTFPNELQWKKLCKQSNKRLASSTLNWEKETFIYEIVHDKNEQEHLWFTDVELQMLNIGKYDATIQLV